MDLQQQQHRPRQLYQFKCGQAYAHVDLPLDTADQLALYERIHRAPVEEIERTVSVKKILPSESASPTVQYLAQVLGDDVFLKVSFEQQAGVSDRQKKRYAGIRAEQRIYAEVTNQLLFARCTPHLVAYYGLANLADVRRSVLTRFSRERRLELAARGFDPSRPVALVLEAHPSGVQLDRLAAAFPDHASVATATGDVFTDALMQVLWTLECFAQVGLMHGDLHWGNVFVRLYEQPVSFVYWLSPRRYIVMNTCVDVQVYDYDRSQKFATAISPCVIRNEQLEVFECAKLGYSCTQPDTARDIIRFGYYYAHERGVSPRNRQLVNDWLYDLPLLRTLDKRGGAVWYGFPCRGTWDDECKEPIDQAEFFRNGQSPLQQFSMLAAQHGLDRLALETGSIPAEDLCPLRRAYVLPVQTGALVDSCTSMRDVRHMQRMEENAVDYLAHPVDVS